MRDEHAEHEHDAHEHDVHGHGRQEHGRGIASGAGRRISRDVAALIISGIGLAAGMAGELLGWPQPLVIALFLVAILAGAVEIVPRGLRGVVRERSLDINFLVTVAVIGAIGLGQWSEAATVVFLFSLGEALEAFTLARTRRSIQALMAMA
ncbi:MAG: hypothetical protein ACRDJN_11075, partial [Chloroflexota bacterium]